MYLSIIQGVKYLLLIGIFGLSTAIGFLISKSYQNRVVELKEFKTILNIMKTKIKFTYEPLAEIFKQIAKDNEAAEQRLQELREKAEARQAERQAEKEQKQIASSHIHLPCLWSLPRQPRMLNGWTASLHW